MSDVHARAILAVEKRPGASAAKVTQLRKLGGGTFVTLNFLENGENKWIWYYEDKSHSDVFLRMEEIAQFFADKNTNWIERLVEVPVISAIIALIMVFLLSYYVIRHAGDPPPILAQALLLILGFYFGSKTK